MELTTPQNTTRDLSAFRFSYNESGKVITSIRLPHADGRLQLAHHQGISVDNSTFFVLGFYSGTPTENFKRGLFLLNKECIVISVFPSSIKLLCSTLNLMETFLCVPTWTVIQFQQKLCLSSPPHNRILLPRLHQVKVVIEFILLF